MPNPNDGAAAPAGAEARPKTIAIKVLKAGCGRISKGRHVAGEGDLFHETGDTLRVAPEIADALEARNLAAPLD